MNIGAAGVVKLTRFKAMIRHAGGPPRLAWPLGCRSQAGHFLPGLESLPHLLAIRWSREPVVSRPEMLSDRAIGGEKALGMGGGLELLRPPFPLACGLAGILRAIIQIAMLPMFHTGQDLAPRRLIALQFVGHNYPRDVCQALGEFPKELLGRNLVATGLD